MEHAKKMALVEPRLLESFIHQPQSLTLKSMTTLDKEMEDVLGRQDLPADVKVKLYNQVLQRYNTYDDQRKATPIKMQMVDSLQPAKEVPTPEAPVADHIEQETLESVPPRMQKKAKLIINRIKNSSDLQWTPKGELVYKGQVVENTNVPTPSRERHVEKTETF